MTSATAAHYRIRAHYKVRIFTKKPCSHKNHIISAALGQKYCHYKLGSLWNHRSLSTSWADKKIDLYSTQVAQLYRGNWQGVQKRTSCPNQCMNMYECFSLAFVHFMKADPNQNIISKLTDLKVAPRFQDQIVTHFLQSLSHLKDRQDTDSAPCPA